MGAFQLTNAAAMLPGGTPLPAQSLSIRRTRFLADGLRERIGILNCNAKPVTLRIEIEVEATFLDMFAVRAAAVTGNDPAYWDRYRTHPRVGSEVQCESIDGGLRLSRLGRDGVRRTTDVTTHPAADANLGRTLVYERSLAPQALFTVELSVVPREDGAGQEPSPAGFDEALDALNARYRRFLRSCTRYTTSSESLDDTLIARSALDLRALVDFEDTGPFLTAGIPWYAVPFGRDGLIAAYQTLGWNPDLARGTLRLLARYQGKATDAYTDEEPGKIFHELRRGELARLGEIPHRPYYGTVDATPLFALVFAESVKWTADRALWRELLPAAERALTWCDTLGDLDGDGYVEYGSRGTELRNQGWKDSAASLCGTDGRWTSLPAALVEVQAYVYAAKQGLADLYAADGDLARADVLRGQARELREQFERDYWMEGESCYAQALDLSLIHI